MNAQPGVTSPENFPVRSPMDAKQKNGRVVNPVRFGEMGGSSGPNLWPSGSDYAVTERGGGANAGKSSSEKKIGKRS